MSPPLTSMGSRSPSWTRYTSWGMGSEGGPDSLGPHPAAAATTAPGSAWSWSVGAMGGARVGREGQGQRPLQAYPNPSCRSPVQRGGGQTVRMRVDA